MDPCIIYFNFAEIFGPPGAKINILCFGGLLFGDILNPWIFPYTYLGHFNAAKPPKGVCVRKTCSYIFRFVVLVSESFS